MLMGWTLVINKLFSQEPYPAYLRFNLQIFVQYKMLKACHNACAQGTEITRLRTLLIESLACETWSLETVGLLRNSYVHENFR